MSGEGFDLHVEVIFPLRLVAKGCLLRAEKLGTKSCHEKTYRQHGKTCYNAFLPSSKSARVVARERATLGPSKGTITMAPMKTAGLFFKSPIAATMAERMIFVKKKLITIKAQLEGTNACATFKIGD